MRVKVSELSVTLNMSKEKFARLQKVLHDYEEGEFVDVQTANILRKLRSVDIKTQPHRQMKYMRRPT